jgi:hypothetical protein
VKDQFKIPTNRKNMCIAMIVLGALVLAYSFYSQGTRAWTNVLINNFYFTTLALGGLFFMALTGVAKTSWMTPYKRIPEAMMSFLPVALVLMAVLAFFGIHSLYEWSHVEVVAKDPLLSKKTAYLNTNFFILRMVFFFGIWIILSRIFLKFSHAQDSGVDKSKSIVKVSAITLILFGLSFSFASFDWIMSLEPHWFSTIFAIYTFSGLFVSTIAFITLTIIILQSLGYLRDAVNENHFHDLGKWLFGFSTFWAYIWFSQYMLIWYSNIPEETEYFVLREHHNWDWLFYFNLLINWLIPFFALMSRNSKRNKFILSRVCVLLLVGHWLDIYLMVSPKVFEIHGLEATVGLVEIFTACGYAGLFCLVVGNYLSKHKIKSEADPFYKEGLHLHQ